MDSLAVIPLLALGLIGWGAFSALRCPVPALLGSMTVIGLLRVWGIDLPLSPVFVAPAVQAGLGFAIGVRVNRHTLRELSGMIPAAAIVVGWALAVAFGLGSLMSRLTGLGLYTAILASSMGGLPEMTMIALSTGADLAAIIATQTARMVVTGVVFPLAFARKETGVGSDSAAPPPPAGAVTTALALAPAHIVASFREQTAGLDSQDARELLVTGGRVVLMVAAAAGGGALFTRLGIPAGWMVGSMVAVAATGVAGLQVRPPSTQLMALLLVGVGVMVADNLTARNLQVLASVQILAFICISTLLVFGSSLLVAYLIHRLSGWDLGTSFLAAAPAGMTVMTGLALKAGRNPLRVSMMHLCRLVALKAIIPLIFMFLTRS